MGDRLIEGVVTLGSLIVFVAILAVLVSKNANTSGVIDASASGFAGALKAAEAPVSGASGAYG
jgi:PRD1 phage membrane DNA delivery